MDDGNSGRRRPTSLQEGDRAAALPLAEEGLAIGERLAALDRTNAMWRNDVAFSRALVARLRPVDG